MRKLFLGVGSLIGLLGFALPSRAESKPPFLKPFAYSEALGNYFLVYQNRYFGLLDSTGRQIVPCQYDDIDRFYEGMAEVVRDGKHGYVNQQGRLVIPLIYDRANPFQNGEAMVVTAVGDVGYLNKDGKPVQPFSQLGRPYFKGQYTKSWVLQPYIGRQNRESVGEFYTNDGGSAYVPQQFPSAQTYRKTGLTLVANGDKQNRRYGLIDSAGHIVFPLVFDDMNETSYAWKDWVRVRKEGRYGFLDRASGKLVIPMRYEDSQPSVYNRIWVKRNGQWGSIDRTGKVVVPFQFAAVSAYREHRAIASRNNHVGYLDTLGQLITPIEYDQASHYQQGRAKAYKGDSWFSLDAQGQVVDSGVQRVVFWTRVRYGLFIGGIALFLFLVKRKTITFVK